MSYALPPGKVTAFGTLKLELLQTPPSFLIGDRWDTRCDVGARGALIGRAAHCDIVLKGGQEVSYISGEHLLLALTPEGWVIEDCSRWGTHIRAESRGRMQLHPKQPMPVVDDMVVDLPGSISFSVALQLPEVHIVTGGRTNRLRPPSAVPAWIADPDVRELLELLLKPYRERLPIPRFNASYVSERLHWSKTKCHNVRRRLLDLPQMRPHVDDPANVGFSQTAEIAVRAFPSMVNLPSGGRS